MGKYLIFILLALVTNVTTYSQSIKDSLIIRRIYTESLSNSPSYQSLEFLCKKIGNRLSGSPQAAKAVNWGKEEMEKVAEKVTLQEVMVPHWVRGPKETAILTIDGIAKQNIEILALGGSIATPKGGLSAPIIAVDSLSQLKRLAKQIKGKIVFFRRPMDPGCINTFLAYSGAADQRFQGPSEAAKYGAVGVIVRSLGLSQDDFPHTGMLAYNDSVPKIPAAAISTNSANLLDKLIAQKKSLSIQLNINSQQLPDEKSYNVIGEIKGIEFPEEIILVGGHLDSWDIGEGAHDDGTGVVQSIEVLRLFKALNIKPKRTIRAVLFMNEENGVKGGEKYGEEAIKNKEKHIAALESDEGGHTPQGFHFQEGSNKYQQWVKLFSPYNVHEISTGFGGSDIQPLSPTGALLIGYKPDSQRYFDYHHTQNDTFEKVNKRELELGAATMASLVYLLSEYGTK